MALTFGAIPVGAQEAPLPISVTPASGPAGTVTTVSGTGCVGGAVEAGLIDPELGTGVIDASTHGDDLGNWSVELQVPTDAQPGDVFVVEGECIMEGGPTYTPAEFTVPPMTVDPIADPVVPAVQPQAQPATPVVADPSYTG